LRGVIRPFRELNERPNQTGKILKHKPSRMFDIANPEEGEFLTVTIEKKFA
jgi:hypothetical protein